MMPLRVISGAAAVWSLMLVAASERDPPPVQAVLELASAEVPPLSTEAFESRWSAMKREGVPPALQVLVPPPAKPLPEVVKRERHASRDVCQRHGMHKRYFRSGRRQSWRCAR